MIEEIPIKPYLRKGKLVKGHFREIKTSEYPEDCACMHGVDCFDYMGTCVYCGFQLSEEQIRERKLGSMGNGSK